MTFSSQTITRNYGAFPATSNEDEGSSAMSASGPRETTRERHDLTESITEEDPSEDDDEVDFARTNKPNSGFRGEHTPDKEEGEIEDMGASVEDGAARGPASADDDGKGNKSKKSIKESAKVGSPEKNGSTMSHVFNFVTKPVNVMRNLTKAFSPAPNGTRAAINETYRGRPLSGEGRSSSSPPLPQREPRDRGSRPGMRMATRYDLSSPGRVGGHESPDTSGPTTEPFSWDKEMQTNVQNRGGGDGGASCLPDSPENPSQVKFKENDVPIDTDAIIDKLISDLPHNHILADKIANLLSNKQSESGQTNLKPYSSVVKGKNSDKHTLDKHKRDKGVHHDSKTDNVSFQKRRREQDIPMPPAAESLWRLARSSRQLASKGNERADWITSITHDGIITPWAKGETDLPLFVKATTPLLSRISEIRRDSALMIQELVATALYEKAESDGRDAARMLKTLEEMLDDKEGCSFNQAEDKMNRLVDKELNELIAQLNKRTNFLRENQTPLPDYATSQTIFRDTKKPALKSFQQEGGKQGTKGPKGDKGNRADPTQQRDQGESKTQGKRRYKGNEKEEEGGDTPTSSPNDGSNVENTPPRDGKGGSKNKQNNKKKGRGFSNPQTTLDNEESGRDGDLQTVPAKRARSSNERYPPRDRGQTNRGRYNRPWGHQGNRAQTLENHGEGENQQGYSQGWQDHQQGPSQRGYGRPYRGNRGHQGGRRPRGGRGPYNNNNNQNQNREYSAILTKREWDMINEYRKY